MPLPDSDAISTLGMPLYNFSPVIDPTVDRDASGANIESADVACMTMLAMRAASTIVVNGSSAPTLSSETAVWLFPNAPIGTNFQSTPARTGVGTYTITYPPTVVDPVSALQGSAGVFPGFTASPHTVNLRRGWANVQGAFGAYVTVAANVATVHVFNTTTGAAADPGSATTIDVFVH